MNLVVNKKDGVKVYHITDFLTEDVRRRRARRKREFRLTGTSATDEGPEELVLRADIDEHPYDGISFGEWSAANCRLMAALLAEGALSREDVEYYLAYTTSICQFQAKYTWKTVLQFDYKYRIMQASRGFKWGTPAEDLALHVLTVLPVKLDGASTTGKAKTGGGGSKQRPICRQFAANGSCNFGARCQYEHVTQQTSQQPSQQQ